VEHLLVLRPVRLDSVWRHLPAEEAVRLRFVFPLLFVASAGNFEWGRWAAREDLYEWRAVALEAVAKVQQQRADAKEQISNCTEDINERSRHLSELSTAYCREHVTGCAPPVRLTRRADGTYECRCGATF
jgi:hypothetical protein